MKLYRLFIKLFPVSYYSSRFSLDFSFLCDILCADKTERSHTMTTEEKIKGLEHLLCKCPDVITALQASRLIHVSKNTIHAAINEGKLIAYAYRGKRLISKADFIDYLAATTAFTIQRKTEKHIALIRKDYFQCIRDYM